MAPSIVTRTHNQIEVSWKEPFSPKGQIQKYKVTYKVNHIFPYSYITLDELISFSNFINEYFWSTEDILQVMRTVGKVDHLFVYLDYFTSICCQVTSNFYKYIFVLYIFSVIGM